MRIIMLIYRYEMIVQVKQSQGQLSRMEEIISQLKKEKETATKEAKLIEKALQDFVHKIRVRLAPLLPPSPVSFSFAFSLFLCISYFVSPLLFPPSKYIFLSLSSLTHPLSI